MQRAFVAIFVLAVVHQGFAQTCTPPPSGMLSWWTGDDSAADLVGPNDAVLLNGATFSTGKVGKAFNLDGLDDRVDVADDASLNPGTGSFTIDAWVFKSGLQSDIAVAPVITKHGGD